MGEAQGHCLLHTCFRNGNQFWRFLLPFFPPIINAPLPLPCVRVRTCVSACQREVLFTALSQHSLECWLVGHIDVGFVHVFQCLYTSTGPRRWRREPSQDCSHWFTCRTALMFRSTLTVDAVGLIATREAGTLRTKPCVWQTIVAVALCVRPCAIGVPWFCSVFEHTSRFV